jgi:hypothetical protein
MFPLHQSPWCAASIVVTRLGGSVHPVCEHMFVHWNPVDFGAYAYLLGWYLGDGYIARLHRTYQLVISADGAYPGIIEACRDAIVAAVPGRATHVNRHRAHQGVRIESCWPHWPEAFPQHGPGRKHERVIALMPWQQEIVDQYAWPFLGGLLHSDGCRTTNRFSTRLPSGQIATYEYPRWFFSNLSLDIREMFCRTCEQLGVHWTQSNARNISIAQRGSVALLDKHVGPKS